MAAVMAACGGGSCAAVMAAGGGSCVAVMAASGGCGVKRSGVGGCTSSSDSMDSLKKFASILESICDIYMKDRLEQRKNISFFYIYYTLHFRM